MSLRASEQAELDWYRQEQNKPHNSKCEECGESCYRGGKMQFPQCFDCYEQNLWEWVDHDRGEA